MNISYLVIHIQMKFYTQSHPTPSKIMKTDISEIRETLKLTLEGFLVR